MERRYGFAGALLFVHCPRLEQGAGELWPCAKRQTLFRGEREYIDKSHAKRPGGCIWQHPGERVHASVIESARTLSGLYPYRARQTTDLAGGQDFFESDMKVDYLRRTLGRAARLESGLVAKGLQKARAG